MEANVTQNLSVRIVPVNNPNQFDQYGEQMGYYHAYVSHDESLLTPAEREVMRGIVPMTVGYGSSSSARYAVLNALHDYADKFGALCIADTDDAAEYER